MPACARALLVSLFLVACGSESSSESGAPTPDPETPPGTETATTTVKAPLGACGEEQLYPADDSDFYGPAVFIRAPLGIGPKGIILNTSYLASEQVLENRIVAIDPASGTATPLADGGFMAYDDDSAYLAQEHADEAFDLVRIDLVSGTKTTLATVPGPSNPAVSRGMDLLGASGGQLVFAVVDSEPTVSTTTHLFRVAKTGGTPQDMAGTEIEGSFRSVSGGKVWTVADAENVRIFDVASTTSALPPKTALGGSFFPIATSENHLFALNDQNAFVALSMSPAATIPIGPPPTRAWANDQRVVFATQTELDVFDLGTKATTKVACNRQVLGAVQDGKNVYWLELRGQLVAGKGLPFRLFRHPL